MDQRLPLVPLCVALFATASALSLRSLPANRLSAATTYEDVYYLPPATALRALDLGYHEATADLLWAQTLLYYNRQQRERATALHLSRYAHTLLDLDPSFRRAYITLAMMPFYLTHGAPDADTGRAAVGILERGVREFPGDGEMLWEAGATIRFELLPHLPPGNRRDEYETRAAGYIARAWRLGAAPPWVASSSTAVLGALGRSEREIAHLRELVAVAADPAIVQRARIRLEQLEGRHAATVLATQREAFAAQHRAEYPYLTPALYSLVGPRRIHQEEPHQSSSARPDPAESDPP